MGQAPIAASQDEGVSAMPMCAAIDSPAPFQVNSMRQSALVIVKTRRCMHFAGQNFAAIRMRSFHLGVANKAKHTRQGVEHHEAID